MADNLENIRRELQEIIKAAKEASDRLRELGTQPGINLPPRALSTMQFGGENRLSFEQQYQQLTNQARTSIQSTQQARRVVSETYDQIAKSLAEWTNKEYKLKQTTRGGLPGTFPPGFQTPTPAAPTLFPKGQYSNEQFTGRVLPNIGISSQAITQISTAMKSLGVEYDRIGYSVKNYSDGTIRLVTNLKNEEGILGSLTFKIKGNTAALQSMNKTQEQVNYTALQGQQRYKGAFALAQQQGFGPETLTKVTKFDATSGYERLTYQFKDLNGIMNVLPITTDKWGRAIVSTQKQFRTATDAIVRDIREVLRWSIAVSVIYLPMRKISELISLAIDNEAKLADVAVRLGGAQRDLNAVFGEAAKAAQASGESLNGVLEGYALAFQAAGQFTDQTQRTVVANKLLADSLILSKLSSLEQAEALDILSGTLRQVGQGLDKNNEPLLNGTILLDKWVATVNKANVDLATLATAFSITSESAENAGVNIDQLNGIVAALSEKIGALGARETGNAVRAIIGGVYTQGAAEALQTFGISVTDTTGRMRDFLDIMTEIYELNQRGLISEDQLNKLAYTLGGGVRRGQQYLAFLSDIKRVNELTAVSTAANGDAQAALSTKLDTVQTATTRLGNAFQSLAQAMGTSGGILDTSKLLLDTGTSLIGVFEKLISVLGKASTTLAVSGLAAGLLFGGKPGAYQNLQLGIGSTISSLFANPRFSSILAGGRGSLVGQTQNLSGYYERASYGQRFGAVAGQFASRNALGFATGIPGAVTGLASGNPASAGASIGGAIVGTLIAGGNPVGGLIGSVIAQTFTEKVQQSLAQEDTFEKLFAPRTREQQIENTQLTQQERRRTEAFENIYKLIGRGSAERGRVGAGVSQGVLNLGVIGRNILGGDETNFTQQQAAIIQLERAKQLGVITVEEYERAMEALRKALENEPVRTDIPLETTRLFNVAGGIGQANQGALNQLSEQYNEQFRQRLFKGEVTPKQYLGATGQTLGFQANLPQLFVAMNAQMENLSENTSVTVKEFDRLAKIMTEATPEEILYVQQLSDEILQLQEGLDKAVAGTDEYSNASGELTSKIETLRNVISTLYKEINLRSIKLPSIVGLEGFDVQETGKIVNKARQLQEQKFSAAIAEGFLTEDQKSTMIDRAEPLFIYLGELLGYHLVRGITDPNMLNQAADALEKLGQVTQAPQGGLGYQFFGDVTQAQMQSVMGQYAAIRGAILAAGGESKEDPLLAFFKDANAPVYMEKDWKIVQYLLQQIADNTEKQLEGIYNLPEGASFWFPSSVLPLLQKGGGGGLSTGDITDAINNSNVGQAQLPDRLDKILARESRLEAAEKRIQTETKPKTKEDQYYAPTEGTDMYKRGYAPYYPRGEPKYEDYYTQPPSGKTYYPSGEPKGETYYPTRGQEPFYQKEQIPENWWNKLFNFLGTLGPLTGIGMGAGVGPLPLGTPQQAPPQDTTGMEKLKAINFKLQIESRTQLIVDGRTLADIIKPHLGDDLLVDDGTQGGVQLKVVI